ncbi:hypothetical protein E2F46_07805 [Luteimonas aestuarii]|uniref:Leucine-rich repeat domain-containing protein n=1 Tax=Luteimonas aestuarii TaxID=453837 RepID=A0A4R5TVH4_9GAMM|nr:hypothetical protein [Luteimonas aestuarii]TDK25062.1 hypothetical protein E2F46_07805 [Luteimonas aestuarii]
MTSDHYAIRARQEDLELVVTGPWSAAAERALLTGEADRLVLNYALGFNEPSLDFLRNLPIRQLVILDRGVKDLEPIYSLAPTLQLLELTTNPSLTLDLSRLELLTSLGADWAQVKDSIAGARRLRYLFLLRYDRPDISPLSSLSRLVGMTMKDKPRLRSLDGLAELHNIKELSIFSAGQLDDTGALKDVETIESLELQSCGRLSSISDISCCLGLKSLNFSECGEIDSLSSIRNLARLETLYLFGTTNIKDGDLTPLLELPRLHELRMQDRRHYNPRVKDIQAILPRLT